MMNGWSPTAKQQEMFFTLLYWVLSGFVYFLVRGLGVSEEISLKIMGRSLTMIEVMPVILGASFVVGIVATSIEFFLVPFFLVAGLCETRLKLKSPPGPAGDGRRG